MGNLLRRVNYTYIAQCLKVIRWYVKKIEAELDRANDEYNQDQEEITI